MMQSEAAILRYYNLSTLQPYNLSISQIILLHVLIAISD